MAITYAPTSETSADKLRKLAVSSLGLTPEKLDKVDPDGKLREVAKKMTGGLSSATPSPEASQAAPSLPSPISLSPGGGMASRNLDASEAGSIHLSPTGRAAKPKGVAYRVEGARSDHERSLRDLLNDKSLNPKLNESLASQRVRRAREAAEWWADAPRREWAQAQSAVRDAFINAANTTAGNVVARSKTASPGDQAKIADYILRNPLTQQSMNVSDSYNAMVAAKRREAAAIDRIKQARDS